jgi:hypothetical protein
MVRRLNLNDAVADLYPAPPPCFHSRAIWMEYLQSAAAVQNHKGEPKVILLVNGEPKFNLEFDFCLDCEDEKGVEMACKGRCKPDYLKGAK